MDGGKSALDSFGKNSILFIVVGYYYDYNFNNRFMMQILNLLFQFLFVVAVAPFAVGLVRFFKARFQGRKGASPFLTYVALATLFRKEMVFPKASSWVFRAVPFVVLASSLCAAFLVPTIFHTNDAVFTSDFLVVAGILMIGSIFLVLGGLDPGSAFGGMGASREMTISALLEPTMVMVFGAFALVSHSFTIDGMTAHSLFSLNPFLILSVAALIMLALGENARYPVDNPATHLELTMVHEAMILEYSGPFLAILEYASAIKLTVFSFLIANFIFPQTLLDPNVFAVDGIIFGMMAGVSKVAVVMIFLALLESVIAKMRFYRIHEYVSISFFVAFFGLTAAILAASVDFVGNYYTFFVALAVFFTVLIFGNLRTRPVLRYYVLSSLSIALIAVSLGFSGVEGAEHLFFFAIFTVLVKVFGVPFFIGGMLKKYDKTNQAKAFLRPASSYLFSAVILAVAFFLTMRIPLVGGVSWISILFASVALILMGISKMVVMRNVCSQIIGLLVLENGLALFTLVTVKTLPTVVEAGIFAITLISVFVLSKLSTYIRELYGSTDTEELRNLTD